MLRLRPILSLVFWLLVLFAFSCPLFFDQENPIPSHFIRLQESLYHSRVGDLEISCHGAWVCSSSESGFVTRAISLSPCFIVRSSASSKEVLEVSLLVQNIDPEKTKVEGADASSPRGPTDLAISLDLRGGEEKKILLSSTFSRTFSFMVCGDPQIGRPFSTNLVPRVIEEANRRKPLFLMFVGDLTENGMKRDFEKFLRISKSCRVPVFAIPGNHDRWVLGRYHYMRLFGPLYYSFDYGGYHFLCLDNSSGSLYPVEREWITRDLAGSRGLEKFIFLHVPPYDPRPWGHHQMVSRDETSWLLDLASCQRTAALFSGHVHGFYEMRSHGIPIFISAGGGGILVGDPKIHGFSHYLWVTIHGDSIAAEPQPLGDMHSTLLARAGNRIVEPAGWWVKGHFPLILLVLLAIFILLYRVL